MKFKNLFNVDKVICDIDVRYYIDCAFSTDGGKTWHDDLDDDDTTDAWVKQQLPCMKEVPYSIYNVWTGTRTPMKRVDWCPVIDVNEGKIMDWPKDFYLQTHFKVCDQGVYIYSDYDETNQIVSSDCDEYYVPKWMDINDEGYGDYIFLNINGDGTIQDWDKIKATMEQYIDDYLDDSKIKSNVKIEEYL